ncbi:hypothetical protein [Streptomyces sp. NBC_01235]|uniref:hypothetical protein n=1 Tax=Streptomyces sp. NBC_01235 TaxID=2903788 RepID=UPI002E14A14B|nr:hypothetical protein OG289_34065 [Streptomyces sp. NBC_01235]
MSYELRAVIAGRETLRDVMGDLPAARSAALGQGLSLMPMTDGLFDSVTDGDGDRPLGFWSLPSGFDGRLADWSAVGPVAYLEAEYFGGVGEQRAAVWADGALVLGPLGVAEGERFPEDGSPISRALRRLGATAHGDEDEFSAVGLHRHRHSSGWVS